MHADTIDTNSGKFSRLLQLFDYSNGYIFSNIRCDVGHMIDDALQKANVEIIDANKSILLYRLPKEDAMKFDIP